MKCHRCFKELIVTDKVSGRGFTDKHYKCPSVGSYSDYNTDYHLHVIIHNNEILRYTLFFDEGILGRYRMWSNKLNPFRQETIIRKFTIDDDHTSFDGWNIIMKINSFIPFEISSDGIIQKSILNRLLNLKVYA